MKRLLGIPLVLVLLAVGMLSTRAMAAEWEETITKSAETLSATAETIPEVYTEHEVSRVLNASYPAIEVGTSATAQINNGGDKAYFSFTPTNNEVYKFYSTSDTDTCAYLNDSNMNRLKYSDDGIDSDFLITYYLEAGKTYILEAQFYSTNQTGSFDVVVEIEHNYSQISIKEGNCATGGVKTYSCQYCNASYTEQIPGEHQYVNGYCSFCGLEFYDSGTCNDNLTWSLNSKGLLTISGNGNMDIYWSTPWDDYSDFITAVIIENGVTSIDNWAFVDCGKLTSVTIPSSVVSIDSEAFAGCSSLASITIPEGVVSVSYDAFHGCSSLTSITIPSSVTEFFGESYDDNGFGYCENLKGIWVDADNIYYSSDSRGVLFNKEKTTLIQAPGGLTGNYSIPGTVKNIEACAFFECDSLTSVTIPNSVTSIGGSAFEGCGGLTSINIPNSVSSIGSYAFCGCDKLTSVTIPNGVTSIDYATFSGCGSLTNITIPNSVTCIDGSAFYGCSSLKSITIPDGVETIEWNAFYGCSNLNELVLPDSVTGIGGYAFRGCTNLRSINIPNGVKYIGMDAFEDCSSLTSISIPASVTEIGRAAFYNCSNLTGIWVDEANNEFCSDKNGVLFNKDKSIIQAVPGMVSGSYSVPSSVTEIAYMAFAGCANLTDVTVPENLDRIGVGAFEYAGFTSFKFTGEVPTIYYRAFGDVTATAYYPEEKTTWNDDTRRDYGGELTWIPYKVSENPGGDTITTEQLKGDFYYSSDVLSEVFGREDPMELKYNYYYDDDWFLQDSSAYNHELAQMSIRTAFAAFNADTIANDNAYYIKALMDKLGYSYDDESIQYPDPTRYSIGYAIGSKDIADDTTVIMVAVRGAGYKSEWSSNVTVGKTGDHQGFDEGSIQVGNGIAAYINAHKDELGTKNLKVWIVGYSRAAAVANLAAADLCNGFIDGITSEDVFAYCFACPQGTIDKNAASSKYKSIKNIVNPIDFVPKVAMSDWDFTRYGVTYYLPFAGGTTNYADYKAEMRAQYEDYLEYNGMKNVDDRINTVLSLTAETNNQSVAFTEIVSIVAGLIGSRADYAGSPLQTDVISLTDQLLGAGATKGEIFIGIIKLLVRNPIMIGNILADLPVVNLVYPNAVEELSAFTNLDIAHYPELYLAWLDSLEGEYKNYNGKYVKVLVNCPVDVAVYDENQNLVAQIVNDEAGGIENGLAAYLDADGQKTIILPADADYELKLTATDNGTMSYTVAECDMESPSGTKVISYYDIEINSGDVLTAKVSGAADGGEVEYTLIDTSGKTIAPSEEMSGDQVITCSVKTIVDGHGTAGATPCKLKGEYITLKATANEGEYFLGWFDGEDLISKEENYRFRVETDVSLTANFTRNNHSGEEDAEITAPTCTEQGYTTYICSICGDSYADNYVDATGHKAVGDWVSDDAQHWHICSCGEKIDQADHSYIDATDASCDACGYVREIEKIPDVLLGDVDGSESIDFFDAMIILQYYAGLIDDTQLNIRAADVDENSSVDFFDGMYVLQYYAGIIDKLPVTA